MRRSVVCCSLLPAIVIGAFLTSPPCHAQAQLVLLPIPITQNPDSVKIDVNPASSSYNQLFARKWFRVAFDDHVFTTSKEEVDTSSALSWPDIDITFHEIRHGFHMLEARFGPYRITKITQDSLSPSDPGVPEFYMAFASDVNIDSVNGTINEIPGVEAYYIYRVGAPPPGTVSVQGNGGRTEPALLDTVAVGLGVLVGNIPNPVTKETTICYRIVRPMHVRLVVTNVRGEEVAVLVDRLVEAGEHEAEFSTAGLPAGVYFYHLEIGYKRLTRGMTVQR